MLASWADTHLKTRKQRGFTLVELMIIIVILGLGTGLFAASFEKKAKKRGDIYALKSMLLLASRQSVIDGLHFGIHYSASTHSVGMFQDHDEDNSFDNTDTLTRAFTLDPTASVTVVNSNNAAASDVCFKKNGAVANLLSYTVTYVGNQSDTTKLLVIAASGQTFQQIGNGP
jgi:prepilin-type N-terminal cleavage/methylation domain-containing protein